MPRERRRRRRNDPSWLGLGPDELLDVRLCDLELKVEGTALERRVDRLYAELDRAGLAFRPHVWLSTTWFTPDDVTGFAIPFFLAHPALARLERRHMLQVEGGTHDWCMKLLRHETGHALDNAYRLHRRKWWRETFGRYSQRYPTSYRPNPGSRRFVVNLDHWYAQSHPAEDWAETFAVWLTPKAKWRQRYKGWPALRKLERTSAAMAELRDERPKLRSRRRPESLPTQRITLREYYATKQRYYGHHLPGAHDDLLGRIFSADPYHAGRPLASSFLTRHRARLVAMVAHVTGQHPYVVDQALTEMVATCRRLRLRVTRPGHAVETEAAILLTRLTASYLHGGRAEFLR